MTTRARVDAPIEPQRLDEVLDVAAALFHEKGYRSTSLTDIGNLLGIHKASLYHYVSSKEELLRRVVFRASAQLRDMSTDPRLSEFSPPVALERLVRSHCEVLMAHPHEFGVLIDQRRHIEACVIEEIAVRERAYVVAVRRVIERGVATGDFRSVDSGVATRLLFELANSVLRWFRPGGRLSEAEVINEVWTFVSGGLLEPTQE